MISIENINSYLPKNQINNKQLKKLLKKDYKKILKYTGFKKLYVLKNTLNPNDFFFKSIQSFFLSTKLNANSIDALIFSSHSRYYEMPIFSASIQDKFNLKNNIICYDLPGSCSGFTNGLIHSYSLIKSNLARNVLLICADAHSLKLKGKNLKPLVSDGLSCIFIKKDKNIFYSDFGVDGKNNKILKKKSVNDSLIMSGIDVLKFGLDRVPSSILKVKKLTKKKIDYYSLHQPNKSIFNLLINKINIDKRKVISCSNFGNTSSPSIPISLSNYFGNILIKNKVFLFCGFGSGLSWSSVITKLKKTKISKIKFIE